MLPNLCSWPRGTRCRRCLLESYCILFSFVTAAKAAPYVLQNLTDLEVNISGKIILECRVSGTPEPQVTWSKDGYPISAASGEHTCYSTALTRGDEWHCGIATSRDLQPHGYCQHG